MRRFRDNPNQLKPRQRGRKKLRREKLGEVIPNVLHDSRQVIDPISLGIFKIEDFIVLPSDECEDVVEGGISISLNHLVDSRFEGLQLLFLVQHIQQVNLEMFI